MGEKVWICFMVVGHCSGSKLEGENEVIFSKDANIV